MKLDEEIARRRTFAIISHPDAGKTTLTEKLLLFGGAINTAGAVKSNKIKKTATSDFMEIEKQRGISVTTSVMGFEYAGKQINLLDTPGHKDFAEDTYRTLTAVDSVVLVIDAANGVEEQTKKLMEVCRLRNTPVMILINKMDREGKDPFDLLDELEQTLDIKVKPLTWPINSGARFKGVYDLHRQQLNLFSPNKTKIAEDVHTFKNLDDKQLIKHIGEDNAEQLQEDIEIIETIYPEYTNVEYQKGQLAPVFFGSAINNFGIKELLNTFVEIAPLPQGRTTDKRYVEADESKFAGFVFKIHANLDPKHRDRIAFCRIVSGKFMRNTFYHHVRQNKKFKFSNPTSFMAQNQKTIETAFPGDVIGIYDTGNFKIGDTITEGESIQFTGIPSFSPEIFKELINKDPLKSKQLDKGIQQLTEEGVAQLFYLEPGHRKIIGAVGELQFDVIQYRLQHEYKAKCELPPIQLYKACWIGSENDTQMQQFLHKKASNIGKDKDNHPVFLSPSKWLLEMAEKDYPDIQFFTTSEFKLHTDEKSMST